MDLQDASKVLQVGKDLGDEAKEELKDFIHNNSDIFVWKLEDMIGIDPRISCHHLQIDPAQTLYRQKMRTLNAKRYDALKEEVEKLISNGFIREATYPKWIFNHVMVKKHNGKWRVYIDFSNLNQTYPKDSFPLPRIDQLVDSITRHKLLSFMDTYSGFNQISIYQKEEDNISFITDMGYIVIK